MSKVINRIGEEKVNKFSSKMIIKEYRKYNDIDVYFPEYDWIFEHTRYDHFKNGNIKCPYEPRVYGKGYLGEGKYKTKENGKTKREYKIWHSMLRRCYDPKYHEKEPTYKDCEVEDDWLNFQNFAKWYHKNYYEISGEVMCLDKDILYKRNKIYSKDTCMFVPQRINTLFIKRGKSRGDSPIGTTPNSSGNYEVRCNNRYGKSIYLGEYSTEEDAFRMYKQYKEKVIKEVIDSYEGIIPEPFYSRLRESMYNYEVDIDD